LWLCSSPRRPIPLHAPLYQGFSSTTPRMDSSFILAARTWSQISSLPSGIHHHGRSRRLPQKCGLHFSSPLSPLSSLPPLVNCIFLVNPANDLGRGRLGSDIARPLSKDRIYSEWEGYEVTLSISDALAGSWRAVDIVNSIGEQNCPATAPPVCLPAFTDALGKRGGSVFPLQSSCQCTCATPKDAPKEFNSIKPRSDIY
jgi:hypothetical protein